MARLIRNVEPEGPERCPRSDGFYVDGVCYANAAAKFWANLLDEIREDFPACVRVELSALVPGTLQKDYLHPERALERDMRALMSKNLEEVMKETLAAMEVLGEPSGVHVRLVDADGIPLHDGEISSEFLDADLFPYLAVWPLEWAGIPEHRWDGDEVEGEVFAQDSKRDVRYHMDFVVVNQHVSEGLYRITIKVGTGE